MDFNHYLYQHIRKDTGDIFYIGIGSKTSKYSSRPNSEYSRAYVKRDRSKFWHRIVNKADYEVQILMESDDYDTVKMLEVYLVSLYGRRNLGKGNLVNLTDGGDGMIGIVFTKEHRENISKGNKGRKTSDETKAKQSLTRKGVFWTEEQKEAFRPYVKWGEDHPLSRLIFCLQSGVFYHSIKEASEAYSIKPDTLCNMLTGHRRNKTSLVYAESLEDGIYPIIPEIKPYVNLSENNRGAKNSRSIKTINKENGNLYVSVKEACNSTDYSYQTFKEMLNTKSGKTNTTDFEYYDPEKHSHLIKTP